MTGGRDVEQALRRALHAAVDPIEPSPDALAVIRSQVRAPRHARSALPAVAGGGAVRVAWALRRGLGPAGAWLAAAAAAVTSRFRPAAGSGASRWLRPVTAVATAAFIIAAGSWAVAALPQVISPAANNSQGGTGGGSGGSSAAAGTASRQHSPLQGTSSAASQPRAGRSTSCSPSGHSASSPAGTPTSTPSGSPSGSPSTSASPSATPSGSPSGTGTPSTSPSVSPSAGTVSQSAAALTAGQFRHAGGRDAGRRRGKPGTPHSGSPASSASCR